MGGDDEGFGPVMRGGPQLPTAPPPSWKPGPGEVARRSHDDGFGPPARGRGRPTRRVLGGLARTALTVVLVAAVLAVGTGLGLLVLVSLRLDREAVSGLQPVDGRMNVLVVGSDSREGLSDEELQALGTHAVEGRRTDSIFLLSVAGGRAAMLSFPRDLFVTRCDGTSGRINSAYHLGGPGCLVDTVTTASGIPISHYVEMNLAGFVRIVDAIGGVSLYLDEPMRDVAAGVDLPAGCVHLDGRQAVGFVRARRIDSDLGRIGRQQRFLAELGEEVMRPATLANPPRLFRTAGSAADALTVDSGLGLLDLLRLARAARGLAGDGLATYTVPAAPASRAGAAVLVPVPGEADEVFASFRNGSVLGVAPAPANPGEVEVVVLNGSGIDGLATRVAEDLEARGFDVVEVGNADRVTRSVLRHGPGMEEAARLVAEQVPGARVEMVRDGPPLALVLGPDADAAADNAGAPPPGAAEPPPGAGAGPAGGADQPAPAQEC